jgi:hypothetical protein
LKTSAALIAWVEKNAGYSKALADSMVQSQTVGK